jgi:hypothetical protein
MRFPFENSEFNRVRYDITGVRELYYYFIIIQNKNCFAILHNRFGTFSFNKMLIAFYINVYTSPCLLMLITFVSVNGIIII